MDYVLHILVFLCIFAILAASYNLLIGFSGLFSMAHAAFYGIGAYTFALASVGNNPIFRAPWPFLAALALAVAVSTACGVLIAVPALRVNADYLVVLSFGFQTVAVGIFLNWIEVTGGEGGVAGVPRPTLLGLRLSELPLFLLYALAVTALAYYAVWRVTGTPFGRMLRAVRDDQVAAAAMGKNVVRVKITMFCFAGALAGLAGVVFAQYVRVVDPNSFRLNVSIEVLAMLILGGTANVFGSALGAAVLIVLPEALRFLDVGSAFAEQVRQIAFGVMLILILRFRPQGLLPEYWLPNFLRRRREREVREALAALEREGGGGIARIVASSRPATAASGDDRVLMHVRNVSKSFGGIQALKDFSTTLERGKITSLIGPNGAGKTTAFNVITGFLTPDGGSVHLRGLDITGVKPYQVSDLGIARSFQNLRLFYQMSALDNVMVAVPGQRAERLWRTLLRVGECTREERETRRRALAILSAVGLKDKALELAENLSYAEEKLLAVARLLAMDAELLLLDEPGSGLDPASLEALFAMIRDLAKSGKTICIVEHNLDVIKELSDKVVFLDEGRALAEGPPEAILQNRDLAERYFGT